MQIKKYLKTYQINARQRYRYLKRNKEVFTQYFTVKGKTNHIHSITNEGIYFKTEKSTGTKFIGSGKIRKAINYVFYAKTTTIKELEAFTNFTSALMGLLKVLLDDISRFSKTPTGLYRLTILGCRYFFSGMDRASKKDWEAIVKSKAEFILMSYYYLREKSKDKWMELKNTLRRLGIKLLLDCGEFTVRQQLEKGKSVKLIDIQEYAKFVRENKEILFGYFTIDVTGDAEKTKQNTNQLFELTGIKPIPIWQCNITNWEESDWDSLHELIEEDHSLIGIGATVDLGRKAGPKRQNIVKEQLFSKVFSLYPSQNFHWLGGSSNLMIKFPFFSSDSQGWRQGRMDTKQLYTFQSDAATETGPESWSKERCLEYNIHTLKSVEEFNKGLQLSLFDDYVPTA